MATVHVIGAGLAGLAAAVRLTQAGRPVVLHESAPRAGGRCRSFFEPSLDRVIDNGNHLLVSGNRDALAYVATIGASNGLVGPAEARFPFLDLGTGERWVVRPNRGRLPCWIALPGRRVPGTRLADYLAIGRLARAAPSASVADCLGGTGVLWQRFLDPLARAVLNTPPETASARLLWATLVESFAAGGAGCRPLIARHSLAATLVDPALDLLAARGARLRFGARLRAIDHDRRIDGLRFGAGTVELAPDDRVILALPARQVGALLPEIAVPSAHHAIVNGHVRLPRPIEPLGGSPVLGLIGGTAEWLFLRGDLASLTVSAADDLAEQPAEEIATLLWQDTARALDLAPTPRPPIRIVKERQATIAQTPAALAIRPPPATRWPNLVLAGDWTATGLPATIEGAVRSGHRAADHVINRG